MLTSFNGDADFLSLQNSSPAHSANTTKCLADHATTMTDQPANPCDPNPTDCQEEDNKHLTQKYRRTKG